jgi:hypothetical protein
MSATESMRLSDQVATALVKYPIWKAALAGASSRESVLVRRVDRADEFYYVVTLAKAGQASARMAIDARTGALLRCHGISVSKARLTKWVPPLQVLKAREGRPLGFKAGCESLVVRAATANVLPTLVWRPGSASVTPLLPFHVVAIGDTLAYIRVDGRIYSELPLQLSGR